MTMTDGFHKMEKDHDPVNSPSHYTAYKGLEIIDLTEQMNFNRGNAVKYIARAGHKSVGPGEVEDLKKAAWYIQREIERLAGLPEEPRAAIVYEADDSIRKIRSYDYMCGCSVAVDEHSAPPKHCYAHHTSSVIIPINKG